MVKSILHDFYDCSFFESLRYGSHQSAQVIIPLILDWINPCSVVDVGCGDGTWLSAFQAYGVEDILGLDGSYVQPRILQIPHDFFVVKDLSQPISLGRTFDLAISLEVAEHLPEESASRFVESLTRLSEVVLFSAAIPHQGGTHHVNEQWPDYWIALFEARGYVAVDKLRKAIWNNANVQPWYAQNSFLFVRCDCLSHYPLLQSTSPALSSFGPSVVHPTIYLQHCPKTSPELPVKNQSLQYSKTIQVLGVTLYPSSEITQGEALNIQINYQLQSPVEAAIFTLSLSNEAGTVLLDTQIMVDPLPDEPLTPHYLQLQIDRLDLVGGKYFINPGIFSIDWAETYDFKWNVFSILVTSNRPDKGLFEPPMHWHIQSDDARNSESKNES